MRIGYHVTTSNTPADDPRNTSAHLSALDRWRATFPDAPLSANVDREIFFEDADQLFALQDLGAAPEIFVGDMPDPDPALVLFGSYHNRFSGNDDLVGYAWPDSISGVRSRRWPALPQFAPILNREMRVADGIGDEYGSSAQIDRMLREMAAERERDLMVKIIVRDKYMPPARIRLPKGASASAVRLALYEAFDFTLIHFEGVSGAFAVSDHIEMRREYRIAMIDYTPVAGAGCIDRLDPFFALDAPFDPQVEDRRGEGAIVRDATLAARYREAARAIGASLRASGDPLRNFVLDLCVDAQDRVTIVECNAAFNFGRYAMRFQPIAEAVLRALSDGR